MTNVTEADLPEVNNATCDLGVTEEVNERFFFKDLFLLFFYWKGGYTARRRDREEDFPSDDSLPK